RVAAGLRAVRYRDGAAIPGLLARQLIALALDDDDGLHVGDIVEPVQKRLGALDLDKRLFVERTELDVHKLAAAEIGEGDAIDLGLRGRDVDPCRPDPVAARRRLADAAGGKPFERRWCRRSRLPLRPHRRVASRLRGALFREGARPVTVMAF